MTTFIRVSSGLRATTQKPAMRGTRVAVRSGNRGVVVASASLPGGDDTAKVPNADAAYMNTVSTVTQAMTLGGLSVLVASSFILSSGVNAARAGGDLALGKQVFNSNCAACHQGGNNTVIPGHGLHKEEIEQFLTGGFNIEAITYQIENGKGAMPAWEGTLDPDEITAVAEYVYNQAATNGW